MRLILDSHILLAISLERLPRISATIAWAIARPETFAFASTASLWEIAIKTRLGKLDPGVPLESLPPFYEALGIEILPITAAHALTAVDPVPPTRDPFDRMLLAQCAVEDCRLATLDHPLAARLDASEATGRNPRNRR
ncbi:type II toxin-antitoxin system VapC family toxin [uncultured Methylobacterium sp.]|uniref:type II toxin-antitoxin system VapC family toxin n=1 Tax=uncultured Methylobacterium sp. TaxID=157278 RepID=UPI0035C977ED